MGVDYGEIKHSIPIHAVLRKYGFRAPARESYRIPCPIHGGKDANFSVSERSGLWNCFSVCQRGGSVIDLVAALDKIDIKTAASRLSSDFNVSPAQTSVAAARTITSKVERWNVYRDSQRVTHDVELPLYLLPLEEGYRKFTQETINHWNLSRLRNLGRGENNPLLPPDGVFIPIHNIHGGFCSYSIRRDDGTPKYWNLPGMSKCYPFGLYKNKQDIIDEGFCWLVEGQFDAVALWQKGYKNVIALMGSSLSEQQAMLLLTLTSKLMLCMDGDEAGRLAAAKIKKQWAQIFEIGIFELPDGIDPDQYEGVFER